MPKQYTEQTVTIFVLGKKEAFDNKLVFAFNTEYLKIQLYHTTHDQFFKLLKRRAQM